MATQKKLLKAIHEMDKTMNFIISLKKSDVEEIDLEKKQEEDLKQVIQSAQEKLDKIQKKTKYRLDELSVKAQEFVFNHYLLREMEYAYARDGIVHYIDEELYIYISDEVALQIEHENLIDEIAYFDVTGIFIEGILLGETRGERQDG